MAMPFNVVDAVSAGKGYADQGKLPVAAGLFLDPLASDDLIYEVRSAFVPHTARGRTTEIILDPAAELTVPQGLDLAVFVLGERATDPHFAGSDPNSASSNAGPVAGAARRAIKLLRDAHVPVAVIATSGSRREVAAAYGIGLTDVLDGGQDGGVLEAVAEWAIGVAEDLRLALAANYDFMRRAVAMEYVKATSAQNAAVGAIIIVPGADMPVMTLNQVKMVLQIALAYGQPMTAARIKEVAAIVGGAFLWRTIARQVVAFVPVISIPVKAAIGYSGTYAMGVAIVEFFERGGDVVNLAPDLKKMRGQIAASAAQMLKKLPKGKHISE